MGICYRRRNFLRLSVALLAVTVSGCTRKTETMADISVFNETAETQQGTINVVRRADEKSVLNESFTLPPEDSENLIRFDDPILKSGPHTVVVKLDDMENDGYTWDVPSDPDTDRQDESYALVITIHTDEIRFEQVSDTSD